MSRIAVRFRYVSVALIMFIASSGAATAQVTFDWVTVGNPCNPPDPLNEGAIPNIGRVCHEYRIAKYEVTNTQYVAFLNAVAADDVNNLFNTMMQTDASGGIAREGVPGAYVYSWKPDMGDKPVNFVGMGDALRFVNWLHNRQPTGSQDLTTTESGAYRVTTDDTHAGIAGEPRSNDARFFLPSENELYKAMYYQPAKLGGDVDGYWLFPTQSNVLLPADPPVPSYYGVYIRTSQWFEFFHCVASSCGIYFDSTSVVYCEICEPDQCNTQRRVLTNNRPSDNPGRPQNGLEHGTIGFRVACPAASADLDLDLDVDLRDFQEFQNRLGGPK